MHREGSWWKVLSSRSRLMATLWGFQRPEMCRESLTLSASSSWSWYFLEVSNPNISYGQPCVAFQIWHGLIRKLIFLLRHHSIPQWHPVRSPPPALSSPPPTCDFPTSSSPFSDCGVAGTIFKYHIHQYSDIMGYCSTLSLTLIAS